MQIKKRNNSFEEFNIKKIIKAVDKAFKETENTPIPEIVVNDFKEELEDVYKVVYTEGGEWSVEDIQDYIELYLMRNDFYKVAKAFILYREKHKEARFYKDRIDYMEEYSNSGDNAATSSETDPNANVSIKNVANLEGEVYKSTNRLIQRMRMKTQLQKDFPEVAEQYSKDIDSHIIYIHDEASSSVPKHYCMAVSMMPLLMNGTSTMDGLKTKPPKNLDSFCGQFINLVFLLSSQCKGAVGFGEFFNFFDWACVKEFGPVYNEKFDCTISTSHCTKQMTIKDRIEQAFQNIVYSINQPAGNRSYQSPFVNFNYFDKYYWNSLFGNFVFPDGSKPKWERVSFLQKLFMKWFNKERTKTMLTYPVESLCLLNDKKNYVDKEYKEFAAEMWSKGHSFFVYTSDNADSVASCCFSSETKVLWKSSTLGVQYTTLRELEEMKWNSNKMNLKIFHNGFWIKGKPIKTTNTDFYKVTTSNHKTFFMTDNHINVTFDGEKKTSKLTTDDYLMFNTNSLNAIPEHDEHLTYEQGFAVGAFLGDGSFGTRFKDGTIYDINYSQNKVKYETCMKNITKANHQLGSENNAMLNGIYNNVYPVRISSKELVAFIQKWTNWTEGTHAWDKELNLNCLLQSEEFRKGILDGWYNTDGGNSNRCYTTSEKLKDCMEILITSLGMNSIIDCSDRTDEKVIIRGEEYNRNYPLWCIRWYEPCNKADMKDVYRWKNNSQFFKIISIEHMGEAPGEQYSYCIECNDQSNPYFTLPSGLITHNCRLRNDVKLFTSTTGLTGIEVGSCNVITLNLNRIIQDIHKKHDSLDTIGGDYVKEEFRKILERVYKYHVSYKNILYDWEKRGMITASNAGYIHMNKLYSTFGINGLNEAAEFCNLTVGNNPEYIRFCIEILGTIRDFINEHNSKKYMLNLEMVPAESLGVKNYNWDKEDGYFIKEGKNLYNSYIYNAHDPSISVLDKFVLQGGQIAEALSGGQAAHINLDNHLSKEQYIKLLEFAVEKGTNYFTFNIPNTSCDNCGSIYKEPLKVCPECGSKDLTYWTRVIGFLRPTKTFSKERQIEEKQRVYSKYGNV